jgi:hypothetical protein
MPDPSGPHLTAAIICERILNEQDGVVSAIRIIDRVWFVTGEDGQPLNPQHPITLFISFKSGSARGSFTVAIHLEKPSGEQAPVLEAPVFFEGEERGVNIVLNAGFEPEEAGLYWFDVLFEGNRVTRMPLRAIYQSQPSAGPRG